MATNNFNKAIFILLIFATASCATFSPLPNNFKTSNKIDGVYNNDPCLNPFGKHKLWDFIHNKSSVQKDSLHVSLSLVKKNRLQAKLLDGDKVIAEKYLKITAKDDSCYYTKRAFYIIPILPIIWFYSNEQKRIAIGENSLILERTSNSGGAMIFMAGGDKYNDSWEYERKK